MSEPEVDRKGEFHPPNWLTSEFMERALNSRERDSNLKVIFSDVKLAVAAGNNYASVMYRVAVKMTRNDNYEEKSFIVKVQPTNTEMSKVVSEANLFDRESNVFSKIIPSINKLLQDASPQKIRIYAAEFYSYEKDSMKTAIVLEDLKEKGFRMADKMLGLDFRHCMLVMKTIARYHAASVVLHYKNPELFQPFMNSVWREELREDFEPISKLCLRSLIKAMEKLPDYNEKYVDRLTEMIPNAFDCMISGTRRNENEFNVLCHGDLWLNNMMFRYSEETGELVDMRFVDYQLSHWTSPAVDLQNFLYTSPSVDVADKHDMLVEEYHRSLGRTLTELGCQHLHPTLKQINEQLERRGYLATVTACTTYAVVLAEREDLPDMEVLLKGGGNFNLSESYIRAIKKVLPILETKGYI